MTSITATPNASTGAVDLVISQTSVVSQVLRSNDYGVQQLRSQTGQFPTAASGTTIVSDYECANGVNTYIAYVTDTTVRTNLAVNPRLGTGSTGWASNWFGGGTSNGTTTRVADSALGGYGWQKTWTAVGGNSYDTGVTFNGTSVTPGNVYSFSAKIHGNCAMPVTIDVAWMNSSGSEISNTRSFNGGTVNGGETVLVPNAAPITVTISNLTAPASAVTCTVLIGHEHNTAYTYSVNDSITVGQLIIEQAPQVGAYFDGSAASGPDDAYAWTSTADASTSTYTHYTRNVSTTATVEIDSPWLLVPIAPNYSEQATSVTAYNSARSTNSTVHQIIGRADPIVVMGKLGTRTGKLEVFTSSISDAERLSRVFSRGEAVMLKQAVSGLDMYFVPSSVLVDPYTVDAPDTTVYKFTLDFTEVTRPYGDLAGALGWTYDALGSSFASYDAVTAKFATYDDLTLDSEIS